MPTLVDSYSETNQDGYTSLYNEGGAIGQSFTAGNGLLSSAKVYIAKYGSPTGNVSLKIYAHSGTYGTDSVPTGSPLATSETLDVSTLSTSYELKTFNFTGANRIALTSQYYILVISGGTYDGSNRLLIGEDKSSSSHSGTMSSYQYDGESETWSWVSTEIYGSYDICFYIYADISSTSSSPSLSPSPTPSASPSLSPSASPSPSSSESRSISLSPSVSESRSPSVSESVSESRSSSSSQSPSSSPSVSESKSPSLSFSASPSVSPSVSESRSPSVSESRSQSSTPSESNSPSLSLSLSPSPSPSISESLSISQSPSSSPSLSESPSASPSLSASSSPSISESRSPSATESSSPSLSASPSASQSPSSSISPSQEIISSQVVKVAKIGKSVNSTNPNDFIFHSNYNTFKIIEEGTYSTTHDGDPVTQVFTQAHNLQFTPLVSAFLKVNNGSQVYPPNGVGVASITGSGFSSNGVTFNYVEADNQNIYFSVTSDTSKDIKIRYFLLEGI